MGNAKKKKKEKKKLKVNKKCNFCSHLLENQLRKYKGIGSYFPERVDILLCIINHFRIICSNQMNKKRCFQGLNFKARNHVLNKCHKTKANSFLRYPEMTGQVHISRPSVNISYIAWQKNCDLYKQGYYICTTFSFFKSSFDLYHCTNYKWTNEQTKE